MKKKLKIIVFILLGFNTSVFSAPLAPELKILIEQLQKNPSDSTLREKIIKLVGKSKPDIPEEARKYFVKGTTLVQMAKTPEQQKLAVQSFTEALKFAPWWSDAYYNLGIAEELSEQYNDAKKTFSLYLLCNISKNEKRETQDRIYRLDAKREMAKKNGPEEFAEFLQQNEGATFNIDPPEVWIKKFTIEKGVVLHSQGPKNYKPILNVYPVTGFVTTIRFPGNNTPIDVSFSRDGKTVIMEYDTQVSYKVEP